ncbi:hypothetical protein Droror1_Dr00000082 [Drosera rotundifolia]
MLLPHRYETTPAVPLPLDQSIIFSPHTSTASMAANHGAAAADLDELLDSALDDFQNLTLAPPPHTDAESKETASASTSAGVREEEKVRGLGLGLGLPDLKAKKGKQKKAATRDHVSETLEQLREKTRDAVRGVEAAAGGGGCELGKDALVEEWIKQFEDFAGPQDVESIVETMMQQLLSKEILHEPMKEIGERYPQWLEEHKAGLSEKDYKRYSHQYELIQELNGVYETDLGNFTKIVDLMQRMQECGQPPNDIVRELAPDFDLSSLGQLSPETSRSQQNCCIM